MTTLGYFGAVVAVWFGACLAILVWFAYLDAGEQRRVRDHRTLVALDWPAPDFESEARR